MVGLLLLIGMQAVPAQAYSGLLSGPSTSVFSQNLVGGASRRRPMEWNRGARGSRTRLHGVEWRNLLDDDVDDDNDKIVADADDEDEDEDFGETRDRRDPNRWVSSEKREDKEDWVTRVERQSANMASTTKEIYASPYLESDVDVQRLWEDVVAEEERPTSAEIDGAALDVISALQAEEVAFMVKEADRADKARQMQEMGFSSESIKETLGVSISDEEEYQRELQLSKEAGGGAVQEEIIAAATENIATNNAQVEDVVQTKEDAATKALKQFRDYSKKQGSFGMMVYDPDVDLETVDSHTMIELDDETGEPSDGRTQMVYVDEHTCIGCTNCATIAQSTFFMEKYLGRARVFQQWGDDEETVAVAIETCPVDCIHYVPFDELKSLEKERRGQNINFKSYLVGSSDVPAGFTPPQRISGNNRPRCGNCPSRGCAECPMYGVGRNPTFLKREKERKAKAERRRRKAQLESQQKSADL